MHEANLSSTLSYLMLFTSVAAIEMRNLRYSSYTYGLQALLICGLLLTYAVVAQNPALYIWSAVAFATKAVVTPMLLFWAIRKTGEKEQKPIVGFGPSVIIAVLIMIGFFNLVQRHGEFLAMPQSVRGAVMFTAVEAAALRTNLAVALTVFAVGLYGILTRRDAVKMVIGLCLLENGVHMSLLSLAPGIRDTAVLGIASEVVITAGLLLYLIIGIHERFGSTDTFKLSELHW